MGLFSRKIKENKIDTNISEEINDTIINEEEQYVYTKEQKLQYVENYCDQMIIGQKRLEVTKIEYNQVIHYITDMNTIINLEGSLKDELLYEAKRIVNLKEDKTSYKNSASKMPETKYEYIGNHESEMPRMLKELKESEDTCQAIKVDLHNIEGEKSALKYERKICINRINIYRKLLKIVLVITTLILCAFTYGQIQGEYDYTIGYYIVIVTSMAVMAGILLGNQVESKNLKISELKLNKAIGLLNRYKLRYVNTKSSLDYLYGVYGVKNSYEFSNLWRLFLTSKKEREAYFKMSDNLYKSTENYMKIINSLNLYDSSVWSYQISAIIDINEMDIIKNTLESRRESLRKIIDYNNDLVNRSKDKIKKLIEDDNSIADEVLKIVDRKEKEIQ